MRYYHPDKIYRDLTHLDKSGKVVGKAQMAVCNGNRKGGKTVGHAAEMLKLYEYNQERCMLLGRTINYFTKDKYMEKWWNKSLRVDDDRGVFNWFKERHKIEFTDKAMMADGDIVCYGEAISDSKRVKDMGSYDHCTNIIMDEAIQKGERLLYIMGRSAMSRIFEIWQTAARGYDNASALSHVIFISNVSDRDNWIFNDLRINDFVRNDTKYTVHDNIIVEIVNNKAAAKEVAESGMGAIMRRSITGREYYEAAQENKFQDNTAFISPMGLDFRNLRIQLIVRGHCLGVFSAETGFHVAKIEPDDRSKKICNNPKYHTEDIMYDPFSDWSVKLRESYIMSRVTFQTLEAKSLFMEYECIRGN